MMNNNIGIPTIGARGLQFRSRLEAQWSYVFTELNWNWEYEPYDLIAYTPKFIVVFDDGNELLIDVKSIMNIWENDNEECDDLVKKIQSSGWKKKFMIVGANVRLGHGVSVGIIGGFGDDIDDSRVHYFLVNPVVVLNTIDEIWSIIDNSSGSDSYDIGLNNGEKLDHHTLIHADTQTLFQQIWTKSKNMTQWKKKSK